MSEGMAANAALTGTTNKRGMVAPEGRIEAFTDRNTETAHDAGRPNAPTHVTSQNGEMVPIVEIKAVHIGVGNLSSQLDENDRYYQVVAEMFTGESKAEARHIELRRNLSENEARHYCKAFCMEGIDFIYWSGGDGYVNPRFAGEYEAIMLPNWQFD